MNIELALIPAAILAASSAPSGYTDGGIGTGASEVYADRTRAARSR
jgi:hypothetical protein